MSPRDQQIFVHRLVFAIFFTLNGDDLSQGFPRTQTTNWFRSSFASLAFPIARPDAECVGCEGVNVGGDKSQKKNGHVLYDVYFLPE